MTLLYLFSFFRTILIIIGVVFVLRLIGKMSIAKRNMRAQHESDQEARKSNELREESKRNFGKTTVSNIGKGKVDDGEYVDYEEVD